LIRQPGSTTAGCSDCADAIVVPADQSAAQGVAFKGVDAPPIQAVWSAEKSARA
jgi:hypothetical protein